MTTEIAAAQAVVEAKVDAEGARQEAQAATVAAVTAEAAAGAALAEAGVVKELAEREVANATLDAEQRIAAFEGELSTCRNELKELRQLLTEMAASHRSIQSELTTLAWLKELEMTPEKTAEIAAAATAATASATSDSDGGKTPPEKESAAPAKTEKEKPAEPEASAKEKPKAEAAPAPAKHRWL